ncbi:MAG: dihydrolipoyl dehydrogenase family protein [Rubricoccaceae bacterium]
MTPDFDVAVVGGGAAGLTAAGMAAGLGARTLMVERDRLGGDCTWDGCVPSKTLLHAARLAQDARTAGRFGLRLPEPTVDFGAAIGAVHRIRQEIYEDADAPEIFEAMGVEVARGAARFVNAGTLEIVAEGGARRRVTARRFILCTGGRAAVPPVDGLGDVPYLTSATLFEQTERPDRLVVLGGGPIGCEMAQAFRRLGSAVTVLDQAERLLGRDDAESARILQDVLAAEGVRFVLGARVTRAEQTAGGGVRLRLERGASVEGDALLVATGRRPNIEDLGLEAARVAYTRDGIVVDEHCRTNRPHIFAAGDCTGEYQLTHMSEHMAKTAVTNAVLRVPATLDRAHVSWCTFTSPEVAQLGKTEAQLREAGAAFEVYRFPYRRVDRALTEGVPTGQIKVLATRVRGRILGASVIGERAGELIGVYAVAMKNGVSLRQIADTIFPYPAYSLGARRAADQWYIRWQYPGLVRVLQRAFGYRGTLPPPPSEDRIV